MNLPLKQALVAGIDTVDSGCSLLDLQNYLSLIVYRVFKLQSKRDFGLLFEILKFLVGIILKCNNRYKLSTAILFNLK